MVNFNIPSLRTSALCLHKAEHVLNRGCRLWFVVDEEVLMQKNAPRSTNKEAAHDVSVIGGEMVRRIPIAWPHNTLGMPIRMIDERSHAVTVCHT